MNPIQTFAVGIAPDHLAALIAALLLPLVVLFARRLRGASAPADQHLLGQSDVDGQTATTVAPTVPLGQPATVRIWVAWLMGISAAVHLALPLGHFDGALLTLAFVGSGVAYAWLALRAWEGRSYRLWSSLLVVATLIAYLVVTGSGGEEPDQVGIATALIELAALGLCLVPTRSPDRPKRWRRFVASTATITATFLVGVVIWIGSFAAHAATDGDVATTPADATEAVEHSHDVAGLPAQVPPDGHAHDHAARAQAGIIMRPQEEHTATAEQQAAAAALADATRAAMTRFARLPDAIAAGYLLPAKATGPDVHLENKAYKSDGRILDPERPETLVYAIDGGRATLLGVVYVMERARCAGPAAGRADHPVACAQRVPHPHPARVRHRRCLRHLPRAVDQRHHPGDDARLGGGRPAGRTVRRGPRRRLGPRLPRRPRPADQRLTRRRRPVSHIAAGSIPSWQTHVRCWWSTSAPSTPS